MLIPYLAILITRQVFGTNYNADEKLLEIIKEDSLITNRLGNWQSTITEFKKNSSDNNSITFKSTIFGSRDTLLFVGGMSKSMLGWEIIQLSLKRDSVYIKIKPAKLNLQSIPKE